jgi:UDP:flavonoid glycosyltransferase YjiC (YdhE family)
LIITTCQELEQWIADAEDGFVLLSFGSVITPENLPEELVSTFVETFRKFPQLRFVWRWGSSKNIPDLPPNVRTADWLPQQDLLGWCSWMSNYFLLSNVFTFFIDTNF